MRALGVVIDEKWSPPQNAPSGGCFRWWLVVEVCNKKPREAKLSGVVV
jgi:hypothetical protein